MKYQKVNSLGAGWAQKKMYEYKGEKLEADIKDQDILVIEDAGNLVQGKYSEQKAHKFKTRNGTKLHALNQTSINNLVDAYGDESEEWVGKEVKAWVFKTPKEGKMSYTVYFAHPDAEFDEESGKFTGFGDTDEDGDIELPE